MLRNFLNVVPRGIRIAALAIVILATLIGLTLGIAWRTIESLAPAPDAVIRLALIGFAIGLVLGTFFAFWLLSLGFVYADARRRLMRPVLWVLVTALFPHLLGFLLYFVMRQPIASACIRCGMAISPIQRFCSWCGASQIPLGASQVPTSNASPFTTESTAR